eukprot:GHVO01070220.1.p1 GENE.GHVO01070220.1~~GHVO01070220.1.p1  ORF type:complete len:198 (-),score=29.19 GHVO01070220.1:125-718(-)
MPRGIRYWSQIIGCGCRCCIYRTIHCIIHCTVSYTALYHTLHALYHTLYALYHTGIPTANLDTTDPLPGHTPLPLPGVYFGWSLLKLRNKSYVYPMVMSLGYNPYYDNVDITIEPHLLFCDEPTFLGEVLKLVVVGMLRPESAYVQFAHLLQAIQLDCESAIELLQHPQSKQHISLLTRDIPDVIIMPTETSSTPPL